MIEHLFLWGLTPGHARTDILLPGSPERCVQRMAVEDTAGTLWMIERLHPGQFDRRERIGRTLNQLNLAGLPIPAYQADESGNYAPEHDGYNWQLSPFIHGDPLPQPEFVDHAERGEALGHFIAGLRKASLTIREFDTAPPFILEDYVNELMGTMAPRRPDAYEALQPVVAAVTPLFEAWPDLPVSLCQGDFHPLNVIWHERSVAAVIDWEFMGLRPVLFDVANCFGCVGIEDPQALVRGLAPAMLRTLRDEACLDDLSLSLLPELVLTLRFAWMSEWLRKKDHEMAKMEIQYMRLLANSIDTLLPAWRTVLER